MAGSDAAVVASPFADDPGSEPALGDPDAVPHGGGRLSETLIGAPPVQGAPGSRDDEGLSDLYDQPTSPT